VHFPLALLPVSTLLEIASAVFRKRELSTAGWWVQLLGVVGIGAAVLTGLLAEARAGVAGETHARLEVHSQTAFFAAAVWASMLLWRIAQRTEIPRPRILYLLLMVAGTLLLIEVGFLGGELVFLHGVGVR
jgi:uncharacterized membrane protein